MLGFYNKFIKPTKTWSKFQKHQKNQFVYF